MIATSPTPSGATSTPDGWGRARREERPFPGADDYRTPVPGLSLRGRAIHPGANITGLPGYNAARIICDDLGLAPWWTPPGPERQWAALH
ncbi:MAG TPA: hypothetical protein DCQ64_13625 [Candidatus Rokubacteria bacterium]|nr:MAG: hypothetical protein A2X53_17445 [Candidatus Rokubacteria bacterium GWA2_70_23]OGK94831.1 MAG: hypothetical protein A2X50_06795 [Candidatus Rokubacteria bacterium GWF2_70_14]HAM56370.1 hypothetical protein [Candidatus Rokubacteria bacterium]